MGNIWSRLFGSSNQTATDEIPLSQAQVVIDMPRSLEGRFLSKPPETTGLFSPAGSYRIASIFCSGWTTCATLRVSEGSWSNMFH